jgi:RES domain
MRPAPPPGNLAQQSLPLQLFAAPVFRLWQNHHPSAFFWSKERIYRFDSKSARYGVLYTGGTFEGAALEVFGDQWVKRRVLSRVLLKKYRVSVMLPTRQLSLADTTGSNLNKLGVDSILFASINYRLTRSWARAFMEHPSKPEGIVYHSRKNPLLLNYAFFGTDDVQDSLVEQDALPLENAPGLGAFLDHYEVLLI